MLKGIFIILLYLFIGEVAGYFTGGFMPGSVFGMIFLFISLKTGRVNADHVRKVATVLTKNMTMFFVPASIGLMASWDIISGNWFAIVLITLLSSLSVILSVALIQQKMESSNKKIKQNETDII